MQICAGKTGGHNGELKYFEIEYDLNSDMLQGRKWLPITGLSITEGGSVCFTWTFPRNQDATLKNVNV